MAWTMEQAGLTHIGRPSKRATTLFQRIRLLFEMVAMEHTLFALPFAYAGAFLAADGMPTGWQLTWITVAMFGARTAAMGLNRYVDRHIDALTPRTRNRHLPAGRVSPTETLVFTIVAAGILVWAAWMLNPLCVAFLPLVIPALVFYPYTKRFTWTCHYWMLPAQFFAPFGGWIAVSGKVEWPPVLLGLAVGLWIAAFDIFYAVQDMEADRKNGIHSLPARFGVGPAFWVGRVTHVLTMLLLVAAGWLMQSGMFYYLGLGVMAVLLVVQHRMVSPRDVSRAREAFNLNLVVAPILLMAVVVDVFWPVVG